VASRTPGETYFLIVMGTLIAVTGLFTVGVLGITLSLVLTVLDPSDAEVGWWDVGGGLLLSSVGAAAVAALFKLYRVVERRGAFEPPRRS
jgi:hypothetical protein